MPYITLTNDLVVRLATAAASADRVALDALTAFVANRDVVTESRLILAEGARQKAAAAVRDASDFERSVAEAVAITEAEAS